MQRALASRIRKLEDSQNFNSVPIEDRWWIGAAETEADRERLRSEFVTWGEVTRDWWKAAEQLHKELLEQGRNMTG